MRVFKTALAAAVLLGGMAMTAPEAEAMPVPTLAPQASGEAALQQADYRYYPGYRWRRPFYRRAVYGYGWRRPFGWRGYGPGYRRGWHNRRLLGSRAR